jgi:hypothetical protein
MNKDFLQLLFSKPHRYVLVWAYIYSRLGTNNKAVIYIYEIMSRFDIPKSTMKRIVSYGANESGLSMDIKWISNNLTISILDVSSEPELVLKKEKVKPKKVQIKTKKPATNLYSKMIEEYDKFCVEFTGVGCKIDGAQGKSLKQIIKFLETQCKKKNKEQSEKELEENVLLGWKYILNNWDKLDDFNQGRLKLTEINSNMLNILVKLKQKPKINKNNRNEQINQAIRGATNSDYSGLGTSKPENS